MPSSGDAADDPAIWVHPTDPGLSLVIGTDKDSGIATYDLNGNELQFLAAGNLNNADVRYNFPLGGDLVDIVAAGNRTDQSLDVFMIDPVTRALIDVSAGVLPISIDVAYGFTLYRSWISGRTYAIVNDQDGDVAQYELLDNGSGSVDAVLVRSFSLGSQTEGMVADDEFAALYIGEEQVGIWRYGAEPSDGDAHVQVDSTGPGGHLTADVEGLTIYHASNGGGYLLASSQGNSTFVVYERTGTNAYLKTFQIVDGPFTDGCSGSDGIDVTSVALGGAFPQGLFVAQDDDNPGANQNYKFADWAGIAVAGAVPLVIDTTWDPRAMGGPSPLPGPARNPNPVSGADGVLLDVVLSWTAGTNAESHDVYFGTNPDPGPAEFQGNQEGTFFDPGPLPKSTTHYWRIDEVNANGTTAGNLWSFTTVEPAPLPGPATNPNPPPGADGIPVNVLLSWTAGANAESHDVYFGINPNPGPAEFQGNQAETSFDPGALPESTTHYWRIDEVNANGTTAGDIWSFTTVEPAPLPGAATSPNPEDGAGAVSLDVVLNWTAGSNAESHDVYFGADPNPGPAEFQGNQAATSFDPGPLGADRTYYWRIDEVNGQGTTSGEVWQFTTGVVGKRGLSLLGISTATTLHSASFSIPAPEGVEEGDLLIASLAKERNGSLLTPDGWTMLDEGSSDGNKIRAGVFYRIAGPSEPLVYTFASTEDKKALGGIMRLCCADPHEPINASASATGHDMTPMAPGVTAAVDGALVIRVFGAKDDDLASDPYPTGHTGRFAIQSGAKVMGGAADRLQSSAGATGAAAFQLLSSKHWRAVSIAIAPALSACPADIDGSSVVDVSDLVEVILQWGRAGGPADVNQDGRVDVQDLTLVILSWGSCGG